MAGARESRGGDDSPREGAVHVSEGVPKLQPEENSMYTLLLHVVRRGELQASVDHDSALPAIAGAGVCDEAMTKAAGSSIGCGAALDMDPQIWSKIPEDVMWTVLELVPAVKRFQFQAVSPKWRQVLTSANFRKAVAAREQQRGEEPADHSMVACVSIIHGIQEASGGGSGRMLDENNSPAVVNMDIELSSLVPGTFWESPTPPRFGVLAAADGLVWISRCYGSHWYVLNPLTRTCRMMPELPSTSVTDYDYKESFMHMDAGAARVFRTWCHFSDDEYDCELVTSDLAAPPGPGACQWTVARGSFHRDLDEDHFDRRPSRRSRRQYFVSCQGEHYYYVDGVVVVYAVNPGPDGVDRLVEKADVDAPYSDDQLWCPFQPLDVYMVACRGRVFFITQVRRGGEGCRVFVLHRDSLEWSEVGAVDGPGLDRLTAFRYAGWEWENVSGACAAGDLVCFKLGLTCEDTDGDVPDECLLEESSVFVLLGFNVVTRTWELVCDHEDWLEWSHTFELKPSLFICQ